MYQGIERVDYVPQPRLQAGELATHCDVIHRLDLGQHAANHIGSSLGKGRRLHVVDELLQDGGGLTRHVRVREDSGRIINEGLQGLLYRVGRRDTLIQRALN